MAGISTRVIRIAGFGALLCFSGLAQTLMSGVGGNLRIMGSDMAILEAQEARKDIPCTVTPSKPVLGFDLRFHTGYDVTVPLREMAGAENMLTILMRVSPKDRRDEGVYFVQRVRVPLIEEDAKGDATLGGLIDIGEGNYHVDWMMRDRAEHVCSFYWDSEATLPAKDKQMELAIATGSIEQADPEQFTAEPEVERALANQPLNIKLLVNFAPQRSDSSALRPIDTLALVTMLRRIAREPQFGKFSVVAFNIQEQRVLYRQSSEDKIDFPSLGEAVKSIQPGKVDLKRLSQKHGETEFLAELIKQELGANDHPDAVIIASPKAMLDESVKDEELKPLVGEVDFPVFYMNYNLNPQATPWRDSIGRAVKIFKGTEYTITRPRDLWFAVSEMVSRIVKSRHGSEASAFKSQ